MRRKLSKKLSSSSIIVECEQEQKSTLPQKRRFHYTAFYCEENIWHLCREDEFSGIDRRVVFIFNEFRTCPMWGQRAAASPNLPVVWDYHVILLGRKDSWMVWDLDSTIGFPVPVGPYLQKTFRVPYSTRKAFAPLFRVVDADEYVATFSSDRAHMRNASGVWIAPPPSWPTIMPQETPNLDRFIDPNSAWIGEVMTLNEFRRSFAGGRRD